MLGKYARIHVALILLALTSASRAGVLCAPRTVEGAPAMSSTNCPAEMPANAIPATNHVNDIPSAPLPPALWPGLAVLVVLGSARFAFRARRRGIRI